MVEFGDYMGMPRWMMWAIVALAGLLGYAAYGPGIFDHAPQFLQAYPALADFLGFFWKWIVTPAALVLGAVLLAALLLTAAED